MKIPQLARYNGTVKKAYEFVMENISSFPISPFIVIKSFNWKIITYDDLAVKNNCTVEDIEQCFGKDAYSVYNYSKNTYKIAYNNRIASQGRINFTLAHEIGHIILNHLRDFESTTAISNNISEDEYKILENEANCFARNILAPAPLVKQMKFWNILFDMPNYFDITFKASTTRIAFLNNDLYYLTDSEIENMQVAFSLYKKCSLCGTYTFDLESNYCCNCNNTLIKGDGFKMKTYFGVDTLNECPVCENTDFKPFDKYCIICGNLLHNLCTNSKCEAELPSNARYCPLCGNESVFYRNGVLKSWELENSDFEVSNLELERYWKNFIAHLRNNGKIVLYTNLLNTSLRLIAKDCIGIDFINGITDFGYHVVSKKENLDYIQEQISILLGKSIKIKLLDKGTEFEEGNIENNSAEDIQSSNIDIPFQIID